MTQMRERVEEYTIVGKSLPRVDGEDKVIGKTVYAADLTFPGMLTARLLRSPHAHALIKRLDVTKAAAYPGMARVVTAEDLPFPERDSATRSRTVFAHREVVFVGQPVAAVLAEDPVVAEQALKLIDIEYEPLPAVIDPFEAIKEGAPLVRGGSLEADRSEEQAHATVNIAQAEVKEAQEGHPNIGMRLRFSRGDIEKGFAEADIIIEDTYRSSSVHQGYLEPQATVATCDADGHLTLWTSTQGQFRTRSELAAILRIPENKIKIIGTEVGGGFGGKSFFLQPLAAVLAYTAKRPVKVVFTRNEDLQAAIPTPQTVVQIKTGCKGDGTLTALKARIIYDTGAFPGAPLTSGPSLIGGYYRFPNFQIEAYEALTNKVGVGAYRAPGAPEVAFAIESQMNRMAEAVGKDPIEFRLPWAVKEGDVMPHGLVYPPIGAIECLQAVQQSELWERARSGKKPKTHGYGVAVAGWMGGLQPASASVRLDADGMVTVLVGSIDISGTNTALAQIAAEVLKVPWEQISIATGDTSSAPFAGASNGSKIVYTVGNAVKLAAEAAREQILKIAARELEVSPDDLELAGGEVRVKRSPEDSISFAKIGNITSNFGAKYPPVLGSGSAAVEKQSPGFSSHAIEVEVDPETGFVRVVDMVVAQDVGKAINPLAVEGQMQGGATQGLGVALWEGLDYGPDGRVRNPSLLDYRMPTIADVPYIAPKIVEVPSAYGPFGAKQVGEPSIVPTTAAVAAAVYDAVGARITSLPITPEKIVAALGGLD